MTPKISYSRSSAHALWMLSILISGIGPISAQSRNGQLTARDIFLRTPTAAPGAQTASVDRLGIRYTIFLEDKDGKPAAVNPKRDFKNGDCFALEVETNLGGYLYVFVEGAGGGWKTLHPSGPGVGAPSVIAARSPIRLPAEHCWEFRPPAGDERLFVFLSRVPSKESKLIDLFRLSDLAKGSATTESTNAPAPTLAQLRTRLGSRNLVHELFFEITLRHQ